MRAGIPLLAIPDSANYLKCAPPSGCGKHRGPVQARPARAPGQQRLLLPSRQQRGRLPSVGGGEAGAGGIGHDPESALHHQRQGSCGSHENRFHGGQDTAAEKVRDATGGRGYTGYPSEASSKARFSSAYNPSFAIPPNDGDYRAPPMDITFLKDVELVRLRPHACHRVVGWEWQGDYKAYAKITLLTSHKTASR
jgi:hypothetical protein